MCAWTAPRTYVDSEIITHTILNTDLRDNLDVLDNHVHDNASGQGSADLSSLNTIVWADAAADPGNTGTLQRNSTALKYHDGTQVVVIGAVAAAGTPSPRALGVANGTQGAPGTHVHNPIEQAVVTDVSVGSVEAGSFMDSGTAVRATTAATATGTSRLVISVVFTNAEAGSLDGTLLVDGTVKATTAIQGGSYGIVNYTEVVGSGTFNMTGTFTGSATGQIFLTTHVIAIGAAS